MTLRPIRTGRGRQAALREIEVFCDAPGGSPKADRLEVRMPLVEAYEREHCPIEAPDPIDVLQYVMEARDDEASRGLPPPSERALPGAKKTARSIPGGR